ncbi:CYFA0S01e17744g1_1 [Cyberlindnera fabianii]|uniref:CYFA0S01e17744g1_1 n=1 Tax=Cyberlindnera fabianii TaxID=36022 RepID=A0A061AR14_CYBFA|nr:CYFA0S01e17744g1_1 [Cyberlindnera fabianii]
MTRPKYLMTLVVTDLSNVPKPSGHCYVQWRISNTLPAVRGKTQPAHIRDYRCVWKHTEEAVVKLNTNSNGVLLEKMLHLEVFAVVKYHHHQHHHQGPSSIYSDGSLQVRHAATVANNVAEEHLPTRTEKTFLGRVTVNLAEFCGEEGPTSARYLLNDSKVNAVLCVEIGMLLINGDQRDIVVPPKTKRGIGTVLDDSGHEGSSFSTNGAPSISLLRDHRRAASGSQVTSGDKHNRWLRIVTDPVISRLYQKTFEMSWDPRPGEFNADESVDDILHGGDGWAKNAQGERFIDLQMVKVNNNLERWKRDAPKESEVRDGLRSWTPAHIFHT